MIDIDGTAYRMPIKAEEAVRRVLCRLDTSRTRLTLAEAESQSFGNVLAVIHGDGGHYITKHGHEKASVDAIKVVLDKRSQITLAEEKIERLEEENRWIPVGEGLPEARNTDTEWSEKVQVYHCGNRYIDHDWYLASQKRWQARPAVPYTHWRPITLPEGDTSCPSQ